MRKLVTWDDEEAINHDPVLMCDDIALDAIGLDGHLR
jgi:hypothetical protein